MTKILVVDDDFALADVLAFTMRRAGFDIFLAHDGHDALEQYAREMPDLVILDWMLPDIDGLEVCARLRNDSNVPIIMLTVRYSDDDVVAALEAGADEYITKPFSPRQVVARTRALLRRTAGEPTEILHTDTISLDVEHYELTWAGCVTPFRLSRLEARLLQALVQNNDHVLTTKSLIARVWGVEGATPEMLKQLVYRLRSKLGAVGAPVWIRTIPREGYTLKVSKEN